MEKNNIKTPKQTLSAEQKIELAKADYDQLMIEVEPFIKRSEIVLISTEGKWYDTSSVFEKTLSPSCMYS